MHNIISLTLFAVMGLNWKKIKELRPQREPQAERGLGKFPIPRFRFSLCHTTSQSHSAIPAHDSSRRFCKQDKPPINPFLQAEPQVQRRNKRWGREVEKGEPGGEGSPAWSSIPGTTPPSRGSSCRAVPTELPLGMGSSSSQILLPSPADGR